MYRKYIENLKQWNQREDRKPLLVWGARQTGKTFLIRNLFAEEYYKDNYIYVDCQSDYAFVKYCQEHPNAKEVLNYLALDFDKVIDSNVLIIFDEAQECLPVISLMKYFCQDYREIPIIVTGSMVRMKIKRTVKKRGRKTSDSFMFPVGKINELTIYPMNFEEFLINRNRILYEKIIDSYENNLPLDELTHRKALDAFHEFILVGGMPEALDIYLKTQDFQKAREVLKSLYSNYLADMELYQASSESIIRARKAFESIYSELDKESKNFKCSHIEKGLKNGNFMSALDWLTMTFLIEKSNSVKEIVTYPLKESDEALYRLYLSDIGMFSYQSNIHPTQFITSEGKNALSGIFYENYVANELTNQEIPLFYWTGKGGAEFEFLIGYKGHVMPIDVKKTKGSLKSLDKYSNHNALWCAVKVSENKFGYDASRKIITIPFYEVFLFVKDIVNGTLEPRLEVQQKR